MKPLFFRTSLATAAMVMAFAQVALPQVAAARQPERTVVAAESEVTITVDALNVRAGPGLDQQIVGSLSGGTKITPLGKSSDGTWWKISYSGSDAYIYAQYAVAGGAYSSGAPAASTGSGSTVQVTSDYLNVRAGPGLDQQIVGKLDGGASVQAAGRSSDGAWLKISYNGQDAYIYAAYTTGGGGTTSPATQSSAPAAPAPSRNTGGFELGGHIKSFDFLGQMKDIGMTWIKYQSVLPGDMGGAVNVINTAHSQGMKALIGAKGDLGRAGDANYHNEFAGYLASLAKSGADAIEVWNEPNLDREYGGSGHGQVNPENYVDMLQKAYAAIKSANPGIMVIGGANAPTGYFGGNCSAGGCNDD